MIPEYFVLFFMRHQGFQKKGELNSFFQFYLLASYFNFVQGKQSTYSLIVYTQLMKMYFAFPVQS